ALNYLEKDFDVEFKEENSPVTVADKKVNTLIISRITERFPEHNIVSEEADDQRKGSKFTWYIDPIDGTANYSHRDPSFAVSIALAEDNNVKYGCIYIPRLDEMYYAEEGKGTELNGKKITVSDRKRLSEALIHVGISTFENTIGDSLKLLKRFMLRGERIKDSGFCAGQLAYVAVGRADGFIKISQHSWDVAAGMLLIKEAGGRVTDLQGNEVLMGKKRYNLIASNGKIHDEIKDNFEDLDIKIREENPWFA
ncbi:MAG TPA: inositol monophosphatase, partial [Thermoplasmatales archaeon]|nr:inositol monophosphatase [Thermoplasmatales archaeon]